MGISVVEHFPQMHEALERRKRDGNGKGSERGKERGGEGKGRRGKQKRGEEGEGWLMQLLKENIFNCNKCLLSYEDVVEESVSVHR